MGLVLASRSKTDLQFEPCSLEARWAGYPAQVGDFPDLPRRWSSVTAWNCFIFRPFVSLLYRRTWIGWTRRTAILQAQQLPRMGKGQELPPDHLIFTVVS